MSTPKHQQICLDCGLVSHVHCADSELDAADEFLTERLVEGLSVLARRLGVDVRRAAEIALRVGLDELAPAKAKARPRAPQQEPPRLIPFPVQ